MEKKRLSFVVLSIILSLAVFSACAGGGGDAAAPAAAPAEDNAPAGGTSTPAEAPGASAEEAIFWINGGIEAETILMFIETEWNPENPDFQIIADIRPGTPNDYFQALTTAFAAGAGPDKFAMSPTEFTQYVRSEIAMSLEPWLRPNVDDFFPASFEGASVNGVIYAIPAHMDLLALYYNRDMLAEEGVDPPRTWEELFYVAGRLTTDDRYGFQICTNMSGYQNFEFYPFLWMSGGDVLADDGRTVILDSPATAQAFGLYRDLINSGFVPRSLPGSNGDITPFATGMVAMQLCGSWAINNLLTNFPDLNFGVVPYPAPALGMSSSSSAGGWRYMVSTFGINPERSGDFLSWMFNEDPSRSALICELAGKFPARHSVAEYMGDFFEQEHFAIFLSDVLPVAGMEPPFPSPVIVAFGEGLQDAMFTDRPLETIVTETAQKIEEAMAGW